MEPCPGKAVTAREVLLCARRILEDGGDPDPCEGGAYCPYCCCGLAKSDLDERRGTDRELAEQAADGLRIKLGLPYKLYPSDAPLIEARDRLARFNRVAVHTRESALALIDQALSESP